jgi:hypothetical protein
LILLLGLAALASRQFATTASSSDTKRKSPPALLLLGAAATVLTLHFTLPFWTHLPKLRFVQFPWRWMSIIALIACCFVAFAMEKRAWLWFSALFLLSLPLAYFQVSNTWWDQDEMPTMRDALVSGQGFDGTDEYDPLGDDHVDLPPNAPLAKTLPADSADSSTPQAHVEIQRWSTEQKQIRVDTPSPARIALRLLNYPAWRVQVNGNPVSPERMDDVNQMVIPVEPGTSEIRVQFTRTGDRKLGNAISAAFALLVLILFWMDRKNHSKTKDPPS